MQAKPCVVSLLIPSARCRDLTRRHQLANVPLQETVVVVELVVFLAHSLDAVEDGNE